MSKLVLLQRFSPTQGWTILSRLTPSLPFVINRVFAVKFLNASVVLFRGNCRGVLRFPSGLLLALPGELSVLPGRRTVLVKLLQWVISRLVMKFRKFRRFQCIFRFRRRRSSRLPFSSRGSGSLPRKSRHCGSPRFFGRTPGRRSGRLRWRRRLSAMKRMAGTGSPLRWGLLTFKGFGRLKSVPVPVTVIRLFRARVGRNFSISVTGFKLMKLLVSVWRLLVKPTGMILVILLLILIRGRLILEFTFLTQNVSLLFLTERVTRWSKLVTFNQFIQTLLILIVFFRFLLNLSF